MYKTSLILFAIFAYFQCVGQNITVKSFRSLFNDMDARINFPKSDQNGDKCALIKIVTSEKSFEFDGDMLGIVSVECKIGEIWLYIPHHAKNLTIKHNKLGVLRDYYYPEPILTANVYEMVLVTGKVVNTVIKNDEIQSQWVVITTDPDNADLYINDQPSGKTPFQSKIPVGKYTYRISKDLYDTEVGTFELNEAMVRLNFKLKLSNQTTSINAEKQVPPFLSISNISFKDNNHNNRIDGNEECYIKFSIINKGKGSAKKLKVLVQNSSSVSGLSFKKSLELGTILPNDSKDVNIPINGTNELTSGTANIKISFEEEMGLPPDMFELNIETKEFLKSDVKVVDYSFLTENGSIKLGIPIQLKVLIQNIGQGSAENVNISFQYPNSNVFPTGEKDFIIGNMSAGLTKELIFEFIANKLYTEKNIPIKIKITEKFGNSQDKQVIAAIDSKSSGNSITISSNANENENFVNIQQATLSIDVDRNIPQNSNKHPNRYALIIGNEDYSSFQTGLSKEVNVDFAANDANIFKEYCIKTLGIPEKQIKLLSNATAGQMNQGIAWINNLANIDNGKAELIFYYSGHGLPDEVTKEAYLIPVDISGSNITQAIKLKDVYNKLNEFPTQRVTVFLDACFSGGARNQGLITMKSVKIKPKVDLITGNMVVFSSSTGEESSGVYKEKQHGYMTYFLLKKLQESKGDISYKELADYIIENVRKETALNSKTQTPQLLYSTSIENIWGNWRMK